MLAVAVGFGSSVGSGLGAPVHRHPTGKHRHSHHGRAHKHHRPTHRPSARIVPQFAARFAVGADKQDITPTSLTGVFLGGYGIGPVHPAQAVLRPIYARVIAVRDRNGNQVVMGTIDAQGYSIAYQNGPYGFADIAADMARELNIPVSHILLQSTHSHNGPDDIGVWGGVPTSYLAYVKSQTETAIRHAVAAERPAALRWGTADMTSFSRTFGSDTDGSQTGEPGTTRPTTSCGCSRR